MKLITFFLLLLFILRCNTPEVKKTVSNTDTAKTNRQTHTTLSTSQRAAIFDTTIAGGKLSINYRPVSNNEKVDSFNVYVTYHDHTDSIRAIYDKGWDDKSNADFRPLNVFSGKERLKQKVVPINDSLFVLALPYNCGDNLYMVTVSDKGVRVTSTALFSYDGYYVFLKDKIIGLPMVRGKESGKIYLCRVNNYGRITPLSKYIYVAHLGSTSASLDEIYRRYAELKLQLRFVEKL